jgi:hypothetical protein
MSLTYLNGSYRSQLQVPTASVASSPASRLDTVTCEVCSRTYTGKYRLGNLQRHKRARHDVDGRRKKYLCEAPDCPMTFPRIDALMNHSRMKHPDHAVSIEKRRINSKDDAGESIRPDTSSDTPANSSSRDLQNTFVAQYDPVVASAGTSNDEGSTFSVASLGSSATDLPRASGFSEMEIASASRELISVFCDDELLQGLYAMAIQNMIGRRRFANNFQRLLKIYAKNLEEEGMDRLDYLASQLVALQARCVARSVVDRYWTDLEPTTANENDDSAQPRNESSSDEEDSREIGINGTVFEELINFRGFLVESAAFEQFYTNLQQFVSSPMPMTKKSMRHVTQPDSGTLDLASTFGTAHNDSVQPTILSDHFAGISTEYSMQRFLTATQETQRSRVPKLLQVILNTRCTVASCRCSKTMLHYSYYTRLQWLGEEKMSSSGSTHMYSALSTKTRRARPSTKTTSEKVH